MSKLKKPNPITNPIEYVDYKWKEVCRQAVENTFLKILGNNRGEIDLGDKESFTAAEVQELITKQVDGLVQPKIDSIVTSRLAQERNKYTDYEDLKKFKTEHEANIAVDEQKKLEEAGKYEEALKAHNIKLLELNGVITAKDTVIDTMTIGNALTGEIVNQGGYLEESLAMLRASTQLKDGVVIIKGKDANNLEKDFTIAEGVKSFLEARPHLVKANANAGGGNSGAGNEGGGGQNGNEGGDLTTLNDLLMKQTYSNDFKGMADTRTKIRDEMAKQGKVISSGIA